MQTTRRAQQASVRPHTPWRIVNNPASTGELALGPGGQRTPRMAHHGGPVLQAPQITALFWGAPWNDGALARLRGHLVRFYNALVRGHFFKRLEEYDPTIGQPTFAGGVVVASPDLPANVDKSAVDDFIRATLAAHPTWPQDGPRGLYIMHLPPGVPAALKSDGSATYCKDWCGWHDTTNLNTGLLSFLQPARWVAWALVPDPCATCRGGWSALDLLTVVASHELMESMSDPRLSGWFDPKDGSEICDTCEGIVRFEGAYLVSQYWSDKHRGCR